MLPQLLIYDDFLRDPARHRAEALALGFAAKPAGANYPGVVSPRPLPLPNLEAFVGQALGVPVAPAPGTLHSHCRLTLGGDRGVSGVHIDPAFYSGILFLSEDAHARGGTDFFRHRRTGLERVPPDLGAVQAAGFPDHDTLVEQVVNRDTTRPAAWERVMSVPMRFNRLILFSPWRFHDAAKGFGTGPGNGRLVQLFFFVRAG